MEITKVPPYKITKAARIGSRYKGTRQREERNSNNQQSEQDDTPERHSTPGIGEHVDYLA